MAHVYREYHRGHRNDVDTDGGEVVERRVDNPDSSILRIQSLVYTLFGLLAGLLAIRFLFAILGANRDNTFANFIYNVTQPLVAPFQGLFNYTFEAGVSRFESETIVAMIVYGLVAWFVIKLIGIGKRDPAA